MDGDTQLVRQWLLIKTLAVQRDGSTVEELAQALQCSIKTIRRDLSKITAAGFPIVQATGSHGRKSWVLQSRDGLPDISFTFDEALALYLGRRLLEPLAGTLFWEAAQNAFRKVRACLGKSALKYLDTMASTVHHTQPSSGDDARLGPLVDELIEAIANRRATLIHYHSLRSTETVEHDVHPYGLVFHRGTLYLVAFSRDHGEIRHFKVARISEAHVTEFPFHKPESFDLQSHLAGSFGVYHGQGLHRVRIRFDGAAARYVQETRWHASQKAEPQTDGSVVVELCLSSLLEVRAWALSFGASAEVLAPEELRREVVSELEKTLGLYRATQNDDSGQIQSKTKRRRRKV